MHPLTSGPFGVVNSGPTDRYGWYDDLGPHASAIAVGTYNSQPIVAVIDPGVLGPGSGPVVFFSDLDAPAFYTTSPDTLAFDLNILYFAFAPEPSTFVLAALAGMVPLSIAYRRRKWSRA